MKRLLHGRRSKVLRSFIQVSLFILITASLLTPDLRAAAQVLFGENTNPGDSGLSSNRQPRSGVVLQGRETPTDPPPPPRETDTEVPPPPRETDTPVPPPPRQATPTPTRPFSAPTPTPTVTSPAEAEDAPPPLMPYSGGNTLNIVGCDPDPEDVDLSIRRIFRHLPDSGDSIPIPVQEGGFPGLFVFDLPPQEPGGLFAIDLHINSPDCPTGKEQGVDTWTPGSSLHATFALPGDTSLLASSLGKTIPGTQLGEVNAGGVWTKDQTFSTTPKGHIQTFKWTTSAANVVAGKLQASVLPFPSTTEGDLLNPPGLILDWDVTCVDCTFSVDVSSLAFDPPQSSQPTPQGKVASFFKNAWQGIIQFFNQAAGWVQAVVGKQQPASQQPQVMSGVSMHPDNAVELVNTGKIVPPLITTFYFRVVPLHAGKIAGPASNPVRLQWYGTDEMGEALKKGLECQQNPSSPGCPTPVPTPLQPFTVKIVGYHGVIAPVSGHEGCYIATKDTKIQWGPNEILYKAGTKFCPPDPEDKSWWEAVVDFAVGALNWVSTAYNDLKNTVINIVAKFVPDDLCGKKCLGTLLDMGLMALGMPPSIPNFDQLMNEGLDYLAAQAASQLGVPKEVYDSIDPSLTGAALQLAISQAEEAWKTEAEKLIKDGMKQGLEAAQVALSKSVDYVPDGVPVKPDPQGDYQMPTLMLQITRDANIPFGTDVCTSQFSSKGNLKVFTTTIVDEAAAKSFNDWIASKNQQMVGGETYYLYETMLLPLPNLTLGESQIIPVVLKPTINSYWGKPWTSFNDSQKAWGTWYWNGQMHLSVSNPCTKGDSLKGTANQSFGQ